MKASERHDLHRNELLDILRSPRELARKYGLTVLIVLLAGAVAIWLIVRAAGTETRKWNRAWVPLQQALANRSQDQLLAIALDTKTETIVRSWANVRLAELLYNKSQQPQYFNDKPTRIELLKQAVNAYNDALQIGQDRTEIVGQATVGQGRCYENLGQPALARQKYQSIISQADGRFAGTLWLIQAQRRDAFLDRLANEKVVFGS